MKIGGRPVRYLMEFLDRPDPSSVGPHVWERVKSFILQKLQGMILEFDPSKRILGLPPNSSADWFREFCDTRGGTARRPYSRRQRQNIRLAFEEIRKVWEPVLAEPLLVVRNYPRAPRRNFIDLRGLREFPRTDLERIRSVFARSIVNYGIFPTTSELRSFLPAFPDGDKEIIFYNVVFSLIVNTGVTFNGCFSSFCRLKRKHLPDKEDGELVIPRNPSENLWLSIYPDEITRIVLIGLLCHASRIPKPLGIRRRQLREMDPEAYLLGEKPTEKSIRLLRSGFNLWLDLLCRQAGVSGITLETLVQTAQARLPEIYSAEVISSLMCTLNYHPLPPDQIRPLTEVLTEFQAERLLPCWSAGSSNPSSGQSDAPPGKSATRSTSGTDGPESEDPEAIFPFDDQLVEGLYAVCRPFLQEARNPNRLADGLEAWGKECLGEANSDQDLPFLIASHYGRLFHTNVTIDFPLWNAVNIPLVQRWNIACVAGWLAWKLRSKEEQRKRIRNPHTFLGYRRDALVLLCANPQQAITEIGDSELEEFASGDPLLLYERRSNEPPGSPLRRGSVVSCWRSMRRYLSSQVGLQLPAASFAVNSDSRRTHYTRLITEEELAKLLEACIARGTPEARCAYLAILLAYYGGLRAIEIVRLQVSQIVLRGKPMLFIQKGKRGKRRNILLDDVPQSFLDLLRGERDARRRDVGNINIPLLSFLPVPEATSTEGEYQKAKKLGRWVVDLMTQTGLRSRGMIGELPDLHRLRHSYVNRSFLLREDALRRCLADRYSSTQDNTKPSISPILHSLKQVSLNAGHATYTVTLEHYLHILNLLQKDQIAVHQRERDAVLRDTEWLGRRSFEQILSLDHARAHQLLRETGLCVWAKQGERKMLKIRRRDAIGYIGNLLRL